MAAVAVGAMVAGTALQMYGQYQSSKAQHQAAMDAAEAKRAQALEVLNRFEINSESLKRQGAEFQAGQAAAFGKAGVDVSSSTTLLAMEDTTNKLARQLTYDRKEAQYKAEALRKGAAVDVQLAGDLRTAGKYAMYGTFLSGAGQVAAKGG